MFMIFIKSNFKKNYENPFFKKILVNDTLNPQSLAYFRNSVGNRRLR